MIQDRSIISSIKPKVDNRSFFDLNILHKLQTWNCIYFICITGRKTSGSQLVQKP